MGNKNNIHLALDTTLYELYLLKRREDNTYPSLSNFVEGVLREMFDADLKSPDIDKRKMEAEKRELEQKLALLKIKLDQTKLIEQKTKEEEIKEHGVPMWEDDGDVESNQASV